MRIAPPAWMIAFAAAPLAFGAGQAETARAATPIPTLPTQTIAIDARGPLALVEVTRPVAPEPGEGAGGREALLDLAAPDDGVLVSIEVKDRGRWLRVDPSATGARAADSYRSESAARGVTPAAEPYDDSASYRLRLLRSGGQAGAPFLLRVRYAVSPSAAADRVQIRFPAAPERLPPPADVTVRLRDAATVEIAGVRTAVAAGSASGHVSAHGAWEVAWTPRDPGPQAPPLQARLAVAAISPDETAVALSARQRPNPPAEPPSSVLFLVDRSRSVGLPGLSAERDLVRALIDALPPSTRFDTLFFDRATKRLFTMSRPATREAIEAFEAEMVPDRLQNGTDLPAALHEAGELLKRETATFGPRALLVLVTDGALGDEVTGAALERALAPTPGLELSIAAFTIRPVDDESPGPHAREVLRELVAARGGLARELRANQIADTVPAALADLRRGGDLGGLRLVADEAERRIAGTLAPGGMLAGVLTLKGPPPRSLRLEAMARGKSIAVAPPARRLDPAWLRPGAAASAERPTRFLNTPSLVALVEPSLTLASDGGGPMVKGSLDRMVVRNTLSLAYMPRARACYLNRSGATPALRDLSGRVRLSIDLVRGEVDRATIESSTLQNPAIESCLRQSAFEIEVPRAARNDAPVTAVLNMVFQPRTPDKKADIDLGEVGAQIDLVIEEMHRREAASPPTPPTR